jgi:glycerol kinase
MTYILAMDAGTTGVRALLINRDGVAVAEVAREFAQIYPEPGWHEHDAPEIWQAQLEVSQQVLDKAKVSASDIAAIGITNQRETSVIWSRETGEPVYNAIVWSDRRVAPIIEDLKEKGWELEIKEKTGVVPDPTFSAGKIIWLLENVPGVRQRAEKGELAWGTIDTWLLYNLTGRNVHATDVSNASRTMMFNIHDLKWDDDLLDKFRIPRTLLPEVVPSSGVVGKSENSLLGGEIPVASIIGDQQSALFGQACFEPGMAKKTFGTAGCFDMNAGDHPIPVDGLVTNVGWQIGDQVAYTVEGVAVMSGAIVQWLRDGMKMIKSAEETNEIAARVSDAAGVYVVPAHQGLNAPYWDMYARGGIVGLSGASTREHVVRAAIESMAYQTRDIVEAANRSGRIAVSELRIDGGAVRNEAMCQFLADMIGLRVVKPQYLEATAFGAAYLAGLAVGFWASQEEINEKWHVDKIYEPAMEEARREELYAGWQKAVASCRNWVEEGRNA